MKKNTVEKLLRWILIIFQGAAFFAVWENFINHELSKAYLYKGSAFMVASFMVAVYFSYKALDGLRIGINSHYALLVSHFISDFISSVMMIVLLIIAFRGSSVKFMSRNFILILGASGIVSIIWIFAGKLILSKKEGRRCILFYTESDPEHLRKKFDERKDQFTVVKTVKVENIEEIEKEITDDVDSAIIAYMPSNMRNELLKICFRNDKSVVMVPKVSDVLVRGASELNVLDGPLFVVESASSHNLQPVVKRAFDVCFAVICLIITSPIFLATAIAIKLEDHGPVFYKQARCTLGGREFEIYKFRSMIVDAEKNNKAVLASKNDSRITKVGNFIRATRIDELPQLINIFRGDMSVVGPRPERKVLIEQYSDIIESFPYRMKVKAGLTGYAQLMGKYNSNPYNKLLFDLMYVQKFSLLLDVRLILLTLKIVFMKESTEGVDEEFDAFVEEFNRTREKNSKEG